MSTEGYGSWVLVLRRVFLPGNRDVKKTKLDIKSPLILTVLKEVIAEERATLEAKASIHWPNDRVYRHVSSRSYSPLLYRYDPWKPDRQRGRKLEKLLLETALWL
jgi:hypothetical protein